MMTTNSRTSQAVDDALESEVTRRAIALVAVATTPQGAKLMIGEFGSYGFEIKVSAPAHEGGDSGAGKDVGLAVIEAVSLAWILQATEALVEILKRGSSVGTRARRR